MVTNKKPITLNLKPITEAILQLSWKQGNNLEDKQLITEEYFHDIAKYIQDTQEPDENIIAASLFIKGLLSRDDFDNISTGGTIGLYQDRRTDALELVRKDLIKKAAYFIDQGEQGNAAQLYKRVQEISEAIVTPHRARAKKNLAAAYLEDLDRKQKVKNPSWGFPDLDKFTGGIERTRLYAIAGRPGNGKSVFGLNTAINTYTKGHKVVFFTLEMSANELISRLLINAEFITQEQARTGDIDEFTKAAIKDYLDRLEKDRTLQIYEAENSLEEIKAIIHKEKPFLAIIDQLSFVRPIGSYINKRDQYGEVTRELKTCAIKEDAAIVLLCQMNREKTAGTDKSLERLADADNIGQDADAVFMVELTQDKKEMQLNIVKNRSGATKEDIGLTFIGSKYQLKNKAYKDYTQATNFYK